MPLKEPESKEGLGWALPAVLTTIWFGAVGFYLNLPWTPPGKDKPVVWIEKVSALDPSQFGDFLSGAFAPVAFFWLAYSVLIQKSELRLNRKALEEQIKEQQKTATALNSQSKILSEEWNLKRNQVQISNELADIRYEIFDFFSNRRPFFIRTAYRNLPDYGPTEKITEFDAFKDIQQDTDIIKFLVATNEKIKRTIEFFSSEFEFNSLDYIDPNTNIFSYINEESTFYWRIFARAERAGLTYISKHCKTITDNYSEVMSRLHELNEEGRFIDDPSE